MLHRFSNASSTDTIPTTTAIPSSNRTTAPLSHASPIAATNTTTTTTPITDTNTHPLEATAATAAITSPISDRRRRRGSNNVSKGGGLLSDSYRLRDS